MVEGEQKCEQVDTFGGGPALEEDLRKWLLLFDFILVELLLTIGFLMVDEWSFLNPAVLLCVNDPNCTEYAITFGINICDSV